MLLTLYFFLGRKKRKTLRGSISSQQKMMLTKRILPRQSKKPLLVGMCLADNGITSAALAPMESVCGTGQQPGNCAWSRKPLRNISGPGVKRSDLPSHWEAVLFYLQWPEKAVLLWWANKALGKSVCFWNTLAFAFFFCQWHILKKKQLITKNHLRRLL